MYLMNSMTDDAEIKGFDPFAILGVTPSTGKQEIKKQYRALSLIYHPDKVSLRLKDGACARRRGTTRCLSCILCIYAGDRDGGCGLF